MNPYEILQVPSDATADEIRDAYRTAVKKYHPDVTKIDHGDMIVLINEAYDLLSDPERRRAYDAGFEPQVQEPVEEDPTEVYRQNYIRKKREEARDRIAMQKKIFRTLYFVTIPITLFAVMLIFDEFLPSAGHKEIGISEWIVKRHFRGRYGNRTTFYIHYFKTTSFTFCIPEGTSFEYNFDMPEPLRVKTSPVFRIPTEVQLRLGTREIVFEPSRTIYSFALPFHYILLFSCAVSLAMKKYTAISFSVSFAPLLMLLLMWLMFA